MVTYDKHWWNAQGAAHLASIHVPANRPGYAAQESAVLDVLASVKFDTVLEFGCGFGRITKRIHDTFKPRLYVATDVSPEMLGAAQRYIGDRPLDGLLFVLADLDEASAARYVAEQPLWQAGDLGPCDLVVAAEVLMHRTPEQVAGDVAALVASSDRFVLTVDWHEASDRYAEGCYQHDYRALFAPYGTVEETVVPEARQAVYLTRIERAG